MASKVQNLLDALAAFETVTEASIDEIANEIDRLPVAAAYLVAKIINSRRSNGRVNNKVAMLMSCNRNWVAWFLAHQNDVMALSEMKAYEVHRNPAPAQPLNYVI